MNEYSTKELLLMFVGGSGIVAGLVALLTFFTGRVDAYRLRKKTDRELHESESANILQIRGDNNDKTFNQLWKMLEVEQKNINELKCEVKDLRKELDNANDREDLIRIEFNNFREQTAARIELEYALNVENKKLKNDLLAAKNETRKVIVNYERSLGNKEKQIAELQEASLKQQGELEALKNDVSQIEKSNE